MYICAFTSARHDLIDLKSRYATMAGPTSITAVDTANEKSPEVQEMSTGTASPVTEKEASIVSDDDDALKVAGTAAHHFDEKYYARLKRKIVRLPDAFPGPSDGSQADHDPYRTGT